MNANMSALEVQIRNYFGIPLDTPLHKIKTEYEHGDGKNASAFVRNLIRAARKYEETKRH